MSPAETVLTWEAEDPKRGFTLDELAASVQDALRAGLPGDTTIEVRINWSARPTRIIYKTTSNKEKK